MSDVAKETLIKELGNFEKQMYLTVIDTEKYRLTRNNLVAILVEHLELKGIYVSLNEPCTLLCKECTEKVMSSKNMLIIGGVCKSLGIECVKNCVQLTSPKDLTELSLAINNALSTKLFDFLFFDQFSTLLLYNSLKTIEKFSSYLINKIKLNNIKGVMMCVYEEDSKKIISHLSGLCDKTIKM